MQIGLIGLGKMGYNLALNFKNKGHQVIAYDVNKGAMEKIATEGIKTAPSVSELVSSLKGRRVIWLMVPAGNVVDILINNLKSYVGADDILIDGGNSLYSDTERRVRELEVKGILFLGMGVSGGEEGARHGPSITRSDRSRDGVDSVDRIASRRRRSPP